MMSGAHNLDAGAASSMYSSQLPGMLTFLTNSHLDLPNCLVYVQLPGILTSPSVSLLPIHLSFDIYLSMCNPTNVSDSHNGQRPGNAWHWQSVGRVLAYAIRCTGSA
eukprot:1962055-Rhodomonas_salina.1